MTHNANATRPHPWRERLHALVLERRRMPFAWGENDCCLWAADAVLIQTGQDPAATWRGTYATEAEAVALLASLGGVRALAATVGEPIPVLAAGLGDVGVVPVAAGAAAGTATESLAVCLGSHWGAPGRTGLHVLRLDAALQAWRVRRA